MLEIATAGGALAGVVALAWRAIDEIRSFLRLGLEVEVTEEWVLVRTLVDNRSATGKRIEAALLVVCEESDNPVAVASRLLPGKIDHDSPTNLLVDLDETIKVKDAQIILLPFYYEENVDIVDETLGYTAPIARKYFTPGEPYSVRFFLKGSNGRLHRSTHTCFVIPSDCVDPAVASSE